MVKTTIEPDCIAVRFFFAHAHALPSIVDGGGGRWVGRLVIFTKIRDTSIG